MSVAAVMMVKDEVDVIEFNVRWLLSQVDEVIVSDNGSTDGTLEILQRLQNDAAQGRVSIVGDPEVGYYQATKMTLLADAARVRGNDWVIPVDADEFWRTPDGTTLRDALGALGPDIYFATAALFDHKTTRLDNSLTADPRERIGWRFRAPSKLPKVACRCTPGLQISMGNHSALISGGHVPAVSSTGCPPTLPLLVVEHYPWRSEAQFLSKIRNGARAYAATTLPEEFGAHWRAFGDPDDPTFEERVRGWFQEWAYSDSPHEDPDILFSPFPFLTGTWG